MVFNCLHEVCLPNANLNCHFLRVPALFNGDVDDGCRVFNREGCIPVFVQAIVLVYPNT